MINLTRFIALDVTVPQATVDHLAAISGVTANERK